MGMATQPGSQNAERDRKIAEMHREGLSLRAIGRRHDLSGERVRAILKRELKDEQRQAA